jgi:hypothetical protein
MCRTGRNGLLVIVALMAAAILAGCDYYRDTNVVNDSDQTITVRLDGFAQAETEFFSVGPHTTATIAHYGPGGNDPFLWREMTILGPDCSVLASVSGSDFQMDGGTVTVATDLIVQSQPGGRPQEVSSPGTGQPCPAPPSPATSS